MKDRIRLLPLALVAVLAVVGCTPPPPQAPEAPTLDLLGPVTARVGTTVDFEAENFGGAVEWTVDGVSGGSAGTGTVVDGTYRAPARVPTPATVAVAATDASDATRQVEAQVTITAPGTLYVFTDQVHVYGNLDVVDGNVAPDRSFHFPVPSGMASYTLRDMAMVPTSDVAFFVGFSTEAPTPTGTALARLDDVSTVSGPVEPILFDTGTYELTTGVAYDTVRDILYVSAAGAVLAYDGASMAEAGAVPARVLDHPDLSLPGNPEARLALDPAGDRLYVSHRDALVLVFDSVSVADDAIAPDRHIDVDSGRSPHVWGVAYDASRDELYLSDSLNGAVNVIGRASTASGWVLPVRRLYGPDTGFDSPSQLSYDVANDRLVVVDGTAGGTGEVKVFDDASTLTGDVAPSRTIGGSQVPIRMSYGGYVDPTM